MRLLAAIAGLVTIGLVLVDVFNTIILARRTRHSVRLTRSFCATAWRATAAIGRHIASSQLRESFLGIYGLLSLLVIFGMWGTSLVFAFALLQWSLPMHPASLDPTFGNLLYLSATTLVTLETGDPENGLSKFITVFEGAIGFGLLGLVVGYLPVFYQAFASRELEISLLDARASSPPSVVALLEMGIANAERVERYLELWEKWAAELLESHLSFPVMAWFRSHHSNQSWLTALTAMTDLAAVVSLCAEGDLKKQGAFTFAMGRHAIVDIAGILHLQGVEPAEPRLSAGGFSKLRLVMKEMPGPLRWDLLDEGSLRELRKLYEPSANALSQYLLIALPEWIRRKDGQDNWKDAGREGQKIAFAVSDPFQIDE